MAWPTDNSKVRSLNCLDLTRYPDPPRGQSAPCCGWQSCGITVTPTHCDPAAFLSSALPAILTDGLLAGAAVLAESLCWELVR